MQTTNWRKMKIRIVLLTTLTLMFGMSVLGQSAGPASGAGQNTRRPAGTYTSEGQNTRGSGNQNSRSALPSTGQFHDIWVDYNVTVKGRKGLLIHSKFNVQNAVGKPTRVIASFQWADGVALKGNEVAFQSSTGTVMAWTNLAPSFLNTIFNDSTVFLPYSALNMKDPTAKLRFRLSLYDTTTKKHFANSQYVDFNYSK